MFFFQKNTQSQMEQSNCLEETMESENPVQGGTNLQRVKISEKTFRVKQNQNPIPESSEEDRDSTDTACTGNDATRNQTQEAGQDL